MNASTHPCPACKGASFSHLIDFGQVPRSGTFLSKPDESFGRTHLSFDYCGTCALIRQNRQSGQPSHDYTKIPRATARQLPTYTAQIAKSLRSRGVGTQDLIVEIGANDGAFLDMLVAEGFTNLLAIEPSRACAQLCRERGHRVEEHYLAQPLVAAIRERHGLARAVVCRHSLEHVPDPAAFLADIQFLLGDGGILFIEVPNAHAIIHDLLGHELWEEHLHIFSPENLAKFVADAGFAIRRLNVWPERGTTNILLWAESRPLVPQQNSLPDEFLRDVQACGRFERRWKGLSEQVSKLLEELHEPMVAIGASHPQSNYFLFTKTGGKISALVDEDPCKVGRFVPLPQAAPVISTEQFLQNTAPSVVILTAFGYEQWMYRLIAPLIANDVTIVRPYESRVRYLDPADELQA